MSDLDSNDEDNYGSRRYDDDYMESITRHTNKRRKSSNSIDFYHSYDNENSNFSDSDNLSMDNDLLNSPVNNYSTEGVRRKDFDSEGSSDCGGGSEEGNTLKQWSPTKGLNYSPLGMGSSASSAVKSLSQFNDEPKKEEKKKKKKKRKHSLEPESFKYKKRYSSDFSDSTVASYTPSMSNSDFTISYDKETKVKDYSAELFKPTGKIYNTSASTYSAASLDKPISDGMGAKLMEKMGYKKGEGLGINKQGRVAPVELSKQKGRRGLGLTLPDLDAAIGHWDPLSEVVEVKESIDWMSCSNYDFLDYDDIIKWMEIGPEDKDISNMTDFCDPSVLRNIHSCKDTFDELEGEGFRKARTRSNPFETIRGGIFLNRAAMKMANIDAAFGFMFTKPHDQNGVPMVKDDELLYFADVCAGPGGFSEYILWRKSWRAKGFGFTLKGDNDFKLGDFYAGPCETFEPYYGVKENGNVFDPDNIDSLENLIMSSTKNSGVHFMMADGGFSVEGKENFQEILSKQLYLCQFLVALSIVQTDGHFVCKLFDVFSQFSVGLVYLMYRSFSAVSIFKPNTSRPANSERYIVCKHKRPNTEGVKNYLKEMNKFLNRRSANDDDINSCVPLEVLQSDSEFFDYIVTSNNRLGERQIVNLAKIAAFYNDKSLQELRQNELCKECLSHWKVPNDIRKLSILSAEDAFKKIVPPSKMSFLEEIPMGLDPFNLSEAFLHSSPYDWHCFVVGSIQDLTYYIGCGRNRISKWDNVKKRWVLVKNCGFELSPKSLVFGEIVNEYKTDGRYQHKKQVLHIIDAYSLGNEDISSMDNHSRYKMCNLFSEALEKKSVSGPRSIRVVRPTVLKNIEDIFNSLRIVCCKWEDKMLVYQCEDEYCYPAKGIVFLPRFRDPWGMYWSKSNKKCYYFNRKKKSSSSFELPLEGCSSFRHACSNLRLWTWQPGVGLKNEDPVDGVLHKNQIIQFVQSMLL